MLTADSVSVDAWLPLQHSGFFGFFCSLLFSDTFLSFGVLLTLYQYVHGEGGGRDVLHTDQKILFLAAS